MSSIYWYYLVYCLFIFYNACFWSLSLGAEEFDIQDFEQQLAGEQGKWPLTMLILCAFFL
jgi:hypothetical protein